MSFSEEILNIYNIIIYIYNIIYIYYYIIYIEYFLTKTHRQTCGGENGEGDIVKCLNEIMTNEIMNTSRRRLTIICYSIISYFGIF